MSKIVRVLGATVFSLLMYSVPITLTLSVVCDCCGFYRLVCLVAAAVQFSVLVAAVLHKVEDGKT